MAGDEKVRVMLTLDRGLLYRVDTYCGQYGLTRSGFFANLAAREFANSDRVADASERLAEKLIREYMEGFAQRFESEMGEQLSPDSIAQAMAGFMDYAQQRQEQPQE